MLPTKLEFERAKAHAHKAHNDTEERLARSQLRQPDLSPDMEEWITDKERYDIEDMRGMQYAWGLVPERQLNLSVLRGEQDPQNKIPYTEW